MRPFANPAPTIIQINLQFLTVFILALFAFWIWPGDPYWWGMGVISILCVFAALTVFMQALRAIWILNRRERAMKEFLARGKSPKNAKLADEEILERAGMI